MGVAVATEPVWDEAEWEDLKQDNERSDAIVGIHAILV